MSRDLELRPSCSGCGSLSDVYGSNFKHMTLCFSCGKSMAQKKVKCSDCGSTLTSLIRIVVSSTRGFHSTLTTGLGNPSNLILLQDILNCLVQMTKQCLEDYRVPLDIGFSLLRYAEAFSSPGIFKQVFFAIDPEYSNDQFIRILKSKEPVSGTIRKPAMVALEAQLAAQMGYNISCAGGENLMELLNVIQIIILSLKTSNHPTSLAFVDALRLQIEVHRVIGLAGHSDSSMVISERSEDQFYSLRCSCVIGFDLPKTVRSYVQSQGRARKNDSQYIIMLERDNKKQRDHLFDIIRSEHSMTDTSRNRDPDAWNLRACNFEDANRYYVEATGASVTPDSSVSLIYRYCEKLPGDRYIIPRPNFHFRLFEGLYQCETTLPPNAALQTIVGPMSRNTRKKLPQMGALDDHLLPLVKESLQIEHIMRRNESPAGAGTTKRKELHGTTCIRALSGAWEKKVDGDGASFEAYKFDFSCNVDETYSGFVLLIESKLDDDVGNIEVDLYLIAKKVRASVSSCGKLHLSADQIKQELCFQEFSFHDLFGRLFLGSEAEGTERKFLLQTETESLWSSSYTFFLLPIGALDNSNKISWNIDWMRIRSCANVVEFLRKQYSISFEDFKGRGGNILPSRPGSSMTDCKAEYLILFANSSIDVDNLEDMVVLAIHTGRIYSIVEVVSIISAESPFEENVDAASSAYTYVEYFKTMYGIVLKYPGQPLLRLKQSHNPHNLFVDQGVSSQDGLVQEKQQAYVHMPPEILVSINVQVDVLKSFYLLPSLMYRLESLLLASQIREEINGQHSNFYISSSLILEALTTLRCCEKFSLDRLELLGHSVLKYAVSSHLFLKYPEKHEEQLTPRRTRAICNSNLHKLGTVKKLQGYIRDGAFEPRSWAAPGQLSRFPDPCKCRVDILEVPLDGSFQTENAVKVGKFCDRGHRWMNSKTIADCVEALIGAYYVGGGLFAALHLLQELKQDVQQDDNSEEEAGLTESEKELKKLLGRIKEIIDNSPSGSARTTPSTSKPSKEKRKHNDDDDDDDAEASIGAPPKKLKTEDNQDQKPSVKEERIVTAKVIDRYVKKLPCSSHFTASYLTGSTTSVDALAPKLQRSYYNTSPHGTTIYWMRLVTGMVVGVDSRSVSKFRANDPNNKREYNFLDSETEVKFVPIMDGVFATLSGDRNRIHDMLEYVKNELKRVPAHILHTIQDFVLVRDIAQAYFTQHPIKDHNFHHRSVIYISGWDPVEKRHIISAVGDEFKVANVVDSACFGTGSGHKVAISNLEMRVSQNNNMNIKEAVQYMKDALCESTLSDVNSGGGLYVHSLTGRKHELKYGGHIMEELDKNLNLARRIFDERTMFVIFEMRHMDIMTPDDLTKHLKTFDSNAIFASWLGYVGLHLGSSCLLIRVLFSRREFAVNWFDSCEGEGSLRRFLFSISDGRCCHCYLGFASSSLLAEARRMSSFEQLAERMEIARS